MVIGVFGCMMNCVEKFTMKMLGVIYGVIMMIINKLQGLRLLVMTMKFTLKKTYSLSGQKLMGGVIGSNGNKLV